MKFAITINENETRTAMRCLGNICSKFSTEIKVDEGVDEIIKAMEKHAGTESKCLGGYYSFLKNEDNEYTCTLEFKGIALKILCATVEAATEDLGNLLKLVKEKAKTTFENFTGGMESFNALFEDVETTVNGRPIEEIEAEEEAKREAAEIAEREAAEAAEKAAEEEKIQNEINQYKINHFGCERLSDDRIKSIILKKREEEKRMQQMIDMRWAYPELYKHLQDEKEKSENQIEYLKEQVKKFEDYVIQKSASEKMSNEELSEILNSEFSDEEENEDTSM